MTADEAPDRLTELLAEEDTDPSRPHPDAAWRAFKRFAAEAIEGLDPADDQLLFEAGPRPRRRSGGPAIEVSFERQLTLEADGEYEGMRHVTCAFTYPLDALTEEPPRTEAWGSGGAGSTEWIARVEASPFMALLDREPMQVEIVSGPI